MRPQIKEWRDMVAKKYNIREILFFGDFSSTAGMKYEIPRVREITNMVIETQNTSPHYKKDFTDFIMLDYIYQRAMSADDIDTFIIFTGDGHFSSVVRFLVNVCKKEVGIYAVRDSLSTLLKGSASWCVELPDEATLQHRDRSMVIQYFEALAAGGKKTIPTMTSTVDAVSAQYMQERSDIETALADLLRLGYIYQETRYVGRGRRIRGLKADFSKMRRDNFVPVSADELPKSKKQQNKQRGNQ